MLKKGIWLSRDGKTFGPFSAQEVETFKKNGEYAKYIWLWETSVKRWDPINPPPPPPEESEEKSPLPSPTPSAALSPSPANAPVQTPAPTQPAPTPAATHELSFALKAICYDERNVISGTVRRLGTDRFIVVSGDNVTTLPLFRPGQLIWVNILNEAQGVTENVQVKIADLKRQDDASWAYEMKWKSKPALLSSN